MATCLDEYVRRYAADPTQFDGVLDEHGNPIEAYGNRVVAYLMQIALDLGIQDSQVEFIAGRIEALETQLEALERTRIVPLERWVEDTDSYAQEQRDQG